MRRALLLAAALLSAACAPAGPLPAGKRIADGLPLTIGVASNGSAILIESRGAHLVAGDAREQLLLARAPFDGPATSLGRGALLGESSDDGRWIAWLVSKERGDRMGPAKARAIDGSTPFELGNSMPPFVFGPHVMLSLVAYRGESGRGTLQATRLDSGARMAVLGDVPPNGFARLTDGFVAVQRPSNGAACHAVHLDEMATHPLPLSMNLDCGDTAAAFLISPARDAIVFHHLGGEITRWSAGGDTTLAAHDGGAVAFAADGAAWWTVAIGERLSVQRENVEIGSVEGRFPRALYPAGARGAWMLLADRKCTAAAPSPFPACQRLVAIGDAPAPPDAGVVRSVVAAETGFPLAFFAGDETPPALLAIPSPGRVVPVTAEGVAAAIAPDGAHLAAVAWLDDGQRALLVDLQSGSVRELSQGVPNARVLWAGKKLLHTFETRKPWELFDERNGVYAVDP